MSQGPNQSQAPADGVIVRSEVTPHLLALADDETLLAMLRRGDESAFIALVERYHAAMLRLASVYVSTSALAEEVVQETWLGVLQGLSQFEGRSSLKTWIFRILINRAKTYALRESRSIPFSSMLEREIDSNEPAVEPDRFWQLDDSESGGGWITIPQRWDTLPESLLLSRETRTHIEDAINMLPPYQRAVIALRDIEGWAAEEVCSFLEISEANQRVLLHRARAKVRRALEEYFNEG